MHTYTDDGTTPYKFVCTDVNSIKAALEKKPVSVAIAADSTVFSSYTSGVITSAACGTSIDHAVAAVGYGTENGIDYFLVQNSWGTWWGDKGFVKIAATEGAGTCGIN